jgi:tRNA-2-methylthio-N6-dimethylallyladenosine synthase
MSGRARDNRLVHVGVPEEPGLRPRPGDLAEVAITYAAPHHLNADDGLLNLRRTRGGEAWAARRSVREELPGNEEASRRAAVTTLGIPKLVRA